MITLPVCRWRGEELRDGCYACASPKLIWRSPCAEKDYCMTCKYADVEDKEKPKIASAAKTVKHFVGEEEADNRRKICRACINWQPCLVCTGETMGCTLRSTINEKTVRLAVLVCPLGIWRKNVV